MQLTDKHLLKHLEDLTQRWRGRGVGLTANTLAMILHQPTKRVATLLKEHGYRPSFCHTVNGIVWSQDNERQRSSWGSDFQGRAFTKERFFKTLDEQTALGHGTIRHGEFFSTWRGEEAKRVLENLHLSAADVAKKPTDKACWLCDSPWRANGKKA